ncbi:hypothetical protein LTR70_008620 [Exophiala xenobiotica]|uniref:DNA polymerase delta subunit 4 n=1 Tax=Lithohypha guttulata TaxID=1690604 RepID=A0ABR0K1Q8_9EURO|nr:hypothetical protein LTR24_008019 [Lithohypha guttulata]KAK5311698.1 hypothetical protein LTR70_008620 [Exophiala xenobiotica]
MPPKTRRAGTGPTAASQSTLSFKNRVSKSKPTDSVTAVKNAKSTLNEPAQEIITEEITKQTTPEPEEQVRRPSASGKGKAEQVESPVRIVRSPARKRKVRRSINDDDEDVSFEAAEKQAQKISDAQVKKYWKAEEDLRIAPRVHQENVHLHEKILRHFDLCSEYGSCQGITRLHRWKRAQALSLNPPIEVLAVLLKEDAKGKKGEKRNTGRIAYIDELAGAREVEVAV